MLPWERRLSLLHIVTGGESYANRYEPVEKRQSVEYRHTSTLQVKKYNYPPQKNFFWLCFVMLTDLMSPIFWNKATAILIQYIQILKLVWRRLFFVAVWGSAKPEVWTEDTPFLFSRSCAFRFFLSTQEKQKQRSLHLRQWGESSCQV